MLAQPENIERLHHLLTKGKPRQRREGLELLAEEGLTLEDLATKSIAATSIPDLNIRSIIFGIDY